MTFSELEQTQIFHTLKRSIEEAERSPVPAYKIAALIHGTNKDGQDYTHMRTNHWPNVIYERLDVTQKIGNSSATIHAETAAITSYPCGTKDTDLYVTDPFCPNCAKNIAEAGLARVFINKHGFSGRFYKNRKIPFHTMSLEIMKRAGISVFKVDADKKEIEPLHAASKGFTPPNDSPVIEQPCPSPSEAAFVTLIEEATAHNHRRKFAVAIVDDLNGQSFSLTVRAHPVLGFSMQDPDEALDLLTPVGKYSFIQEPVNRLLMYMARHGYRLREDYIYCSQVPTSREQVNLIGAGYDKITIGNFQKCRDAEGLRAMELLKDAGVLVYS